MYCPRLIGPFDNNIPEVYVFKRKRDEKLKKFKT